MATSDLSSVSLYYTEKPLSPEELKKQAEEKKAKVKAEAQQKLQETPIHDAGSSMAKIQQRFNNNLRQREQTIEKAANIEALLGKPIHPSFQHATTNATSSVSVPIGQPQSQQVDRYSVEQVCANIDGYEEVKEDKDVSGFISSLTKWCLGAKTNDVNSTELSQVPAQSAGGVMDLIPMSPEDREVLRSVGVTDMGEGLTQGQTSDKSQAEQLRDKTVARLQEIQRKMNDLKLPKEERDKLIKEAKELFLSTPVATPPQNNQTQPSTSTNAVHPVIVNTSAKVAANMSTEEIGNSKDFVARNMQGIDDATEDFNALSKNEQAYVRATASDAALNYKKGIKPEDYAV